ncbi:MAG: flippase [Salinibacter sp.]
MAPDHPRDPEARTPDRGDSHETRRSQGRVAVTSEGRSEFGSVAQGAGMSLAGRVTGSALRYGAILLLARVLGADAFGRYMLGLAAFQLLELTAALGLPQGIVQRVSLYRTRQDQRRLKGALLSAVGVAFGGGLALGLGLLVAAPRIANTLFFDPALTPVLRAFAVGLPFGAAGLVAARATTGFQTTRYLVYGRELLHPAVFVLGVGIFALIGLTASRAAGAWAAAAAATLLASVAFLIKLAPALRDRSIDSIRQSSALVRFSLPLWPAALASFALLWTDTFILGYFRSAADVGIYRAAAQTALLLMMILHAFNTIVGPTIAALYQRGDLEQLQRLFRTTARWSLTLTLPGFLLVALAGEDVLRLFGSAYVSGVVPLMTLAAAQLVNAATGSVGFALIMTGRTYHHLAGDLALTVLNVGLNLAFIPQWGLQGAATATAISLIGVNLVRLVQTRRLLDLSPFGRPHLKVLMAGAGSAAVTWGLLALVPEAHFLLRLAAAALTLILSYGAILVALGAEAEDYEGLQALRPSWAFRSPK